MTHNTPTQANNQHTYSNPIIAQTTPDPAIIKGLDGYYYVIATSDRWQDGSFHILPTYRSTDPLTLHFSKAPLVKRRGV